MGEARCGKIGPVVGGNPGCVGDRKQSAGN